MSEEKLETKCLKCGKEFPIDLNTAWGSYERYSNTDLMVVIVCPHCKERYEI
jgi:DNA-directed RNA polymerase subunit RPC12/RpoP